MAVLNPNIENIQEGSLTDLLYKKFLQGIDEAQSQSDPPNFSDPSYIKTTTNPDGTVSYEADDKKIKEDAALYGDVVKKNSAFMLSDSIVSVLAGSSGGEGGGTGGQGAFLPITGGTLLGSLTAIQGCRFGIDNRTLLTFGGTAQDKNLSASFQCDIHIPADNSVYIGDVKTFRSTGNALTISHPTVKIEGNTTHTGHVSVGDVLIQPTGVLYQSKSYYHPSNSNKLDVDWSMQDGAVGRNLQVTGNSIIRGNLESNGGFSFGVQNQQVLYSNDSDASIYLKRSLRLYPDDAQLGIFINGTKLLSTIRKSADGVVGVVSVASPNQILYLGSSDTSSIYLQTDISRTDGSEVIVTKYGGGNFQDSLCAGHQRHGNVLRTYYRDDVEQGVAFSHKILFAGESEKGEFLSGPSIYGKADQLVFQSACSYLTTSFATETVRHLLQTSLYFSPSQSLDKPSHREFFDLHFDTDADYIVYNKPLEGERYVGISKSKTKIFDGCLFLDDSVYIEGHQRADVSGGGFLKVFGDTYFLDSIGTQQFSSGFAGSGWKIHSDKTTGNIGATFDNLTIRKKMRVYEFEVQKLSVTNGSLWVSDSCSGDFVQKLS